MGLNLKTREFSVTKDGSHLLTFSDENLVDNRLTISTKKLFQLIKRKACTSVLILNTSSILHAESSPNNSPIPAEIATVLQAFPDVFHEPDQLPPK